MFYCSTWTQPGLIDREEVKFVEFVHPGGIRDSTTDPGRARNDLGSVCVRIEKPTTNREQGAVDRWVQRPDVDAAAGCRWQA